MKATHTTLIASVTRLLESDFVFHVSKHSTQQ
jgi:hypothetical protein